MPRRTINTGAKLAGFAVLLGLVFGAALLAGGAIDPQRATGDGKVLLAHGGAAGTRDAEAAGHGGAAGAHDAAASEHGGALAAPGAHGSHRAPDAVRGLATSADGLRLVVARTELRRDQRERLIVRVVEPDGATLRDFERVHERRMHLIVVRRDLSGFQHLHPTMSADGTWSTSVVLPTAGSYRVFADFTHDGAATTLAGDLRVDGDADLRPLPVPVTETVSDGGDAVALVGAGAGGVPRGADGATGAGGAGGVRAGVETELRFAISRDGAPVALEPYLGADGHLVALREGDLGFLHVHPSGAGPVFATTFPTPGRYRLFLQYRSDGSVRTAAFTIEVAP